MPSKLDFNSTKRFRDFILSKTLQVPNGPQTFTEDNYTYKNLSDLPNIDPGTVEDNRSNRLTEIKNSNTYKPDEFFIVEDLSLLPRRANLKLYWNGTPYFTPQKHNLIGIMSNSSYDTESELFKFAASYIRDKNQKGPVYARIQQNLEAYAGKVRILDALAGNTSTALNILTGREPLVEKNNKITVGKNLLGKGIDFLQTVAGVEFPFSEIPGDYLTNPANPINYRPEAKNELNRTLQDLTGALGSLIGIQRRPKLTRKPSDLFIEYMGDGQKSALYNNISYSKYGPNYTTTARSQNTSKIFNFIDNFGEGVKNILGLEAPNKNAYIGDDRGNDVYYAMNDFNDRPVRSNYYLSYLFDPVQATLFQRTTSIIDGGYFGGNLTWISTKSKNKIGANNKEFNSLEGSKFDNTRSTNFTFRDGSILSTTQEILESLPLDGSSSRSHVANVIDQTSRVFKDGDLMLSRGSAIKYVDQFNNEETGVEYCRVWTKDRSYMNYSDTMRKGGLLRKFKSSVLDNPWNLNIYPNSNGKAGDDAFNTSTNIVKDGKNGKDTFYAKKYMFSIENLAWKTSKIEGFTYDDLPACEKGANGGRVMWFPPYDLKVSETNGASWSQNEFLGRPEPVYTYKNTTRNGNISFKIIVDHPSILNLLVREHFQNMSDREADNYINAFFAGCQDLDFYDLVTKYSTLNQKQLKTIQQYLEYYNPPTQQNKQPDAVINSISQDVLEENPIDVPGVNGANTPTPKAQEYETIKKDPVTVSLYFYNDLPSGNLLYTDLDYTSLYNQYKSYKANYLNKLNLGLNKLFKIIPIPQIKHSDFKILFPNEDVKLVTTQAKVTELKNKIIEQVNTQFTKLDENYTSLNSKYTEIKEALDGGKVGDIKINMLSITSPIADENYNLNLSYRRSYSIIRDIIKKLIKEGTFFDFNKIKWQNIVNTTTTNSTEKNIIVPLKDLGYTSLEGNLTFVYIKNLGETYSDGEINCTNVKLIKNNTELKITAPTNFWCRKTDTTIEYTLKELKKEVPQPVNVLPKVSIAAQSEVERTAPKKPPLDELKRIVMNVLSECFYFKKLEEESPLQFNSLKEKLKYFHPAFHSMTPEGLNSRLTFLHQCIRPGDTIPIKGISDSTDLNARNTTFGAPPICVLRIGDFYHSKVIVRDVNISFDENVWDLNPEGIGVQPMIATVTLSVSFIGGHGLEKPVERLQNALSSNFYANTEVYDYRATATEDMTAINKEQLQKILDKPENKIKLNNGDTIKQPDKIKTGEYIGVLNNNKISYKSLLTDVNENIKKYVHAYTDAYNNINKNYGNKIGALLFSPIYRKYDTYNVKTTGSDKTISLLGEYPTTYSSSFDIFEKTLMNKIESVDLNDIFGFTKYLEKNKLLKSKDYLNKKVKELIKNKLGSISDIFGTGSYFLNTILSNRNNLIKNLDKLNFLVGYSKDAKIVDNTSNKVMKVDLSNFTNDKIYKFYSKNIEYLEKYRNNFYSDLDTSYNFNSTTMTDDDLKYFLSILLFEKETFILNAYVDEQLFTENDKNTLRKILNKFFKKYDKILKLPEIINLPISDNIEFSIITEEEDTNQQEIDTLFKINNVSPTGVIDNKLNYFRP